MNSESSANLILLKHKEEYKSKTKLQHLVRALCKKRKIVFITGAGISASAGLPTFAQLTKERKCTKSHLFDSRALVGENGKSAFSRIIQDVYDKARRSEPTEFHRLMARLAKDHRLLRHYTQNIDCLDIRDTSLTTRVPLNFEKPWPKTIQLHGSIEQLACEICSSVEKLGLEMLEDVEAPKCTRCREKTEHGVRVGSRKRRIGKLRPRIATYDKPAMDGEAIGNVSLADVQLGPDALLVVGTSLEIASAQRLARELSRAARVCKGGMCVWVNLDAAPKSKSLGIHWDWVVLGESDEFARVWSQAAGEEVARKEKAKKKKIQKQEKRRKREAEQVFELDGEVIKALEQYT